MLSFHNHKRYRSARVPCSSESICACGFLTFWFFVGTESPLGQSYWKMGTACSPSICSLCLLWVAFTLSIFISGWDLKGLATPGSEKPLVLSDLINMTQDTLAAAPNSSQCLLSIYCVLVLHTEEDWR